MRDFLRTCPYCGKEGISLWAGGYGGAVYKCPNCQYIGPVVIENVPEEMTDETEKLVKAAASSVNSTLNKIALFSGLAFATIGLIVGLEPLPLYGGSFVAPFGLALVLVGGLLMLASAASWLIALIRRLLLAKPATDI